MCENRPCRVCSAASPRTSLAVPITKTSDCSCIQLSRKAIVRAVSPPSVLAEESRPPTAFSNSLIPRMPLSVVAIESARLIVIAEEPITPPPSPVLEWQTGLYFDGKRSERAHAQAYDAASRQPLR